MSERVPVLYLAPWVDLGGADKGTVDWFRHIDRERFAPSLICTQHSQNRWLDQVAPYAEELWVLPELMSGRDFPEFVLGFIASRGIRVVHVMHSRLGFDLLPDIRVLPGRPATVVQFHVAEPDRTGYVPYVCDRAVDLVDAFSVSSRHLAETLRGYDVPDSRIEVIHTGVDADEFDPAGDTLDLGEGPHVLWPGRLVPQKDPLAAVETAAVLARRGVAFTLHVVGEGRLEEQLRARARELGADAHIAWHPSARHLAPWYRACDLVLMTSAYEGIPYVVFEALATERPVVAPALPGNVELMDDDAGVLVPVGAGGEAYADAIEAVLGRPDNAARGRRSRQRMRAEHAIADMGRRHGELYERLLEGRPPPPGDPYPGLPRPLVLPRTEALERTVAVVIACYEHGRYLPYALETLRAQTHPPHQVIVVDDGSRDAETRALLDELAAGDEVEVLRLERNVGLGAARNRGLELVRSRYVLPLDADDGFAPDAIERMLAELEGAPPEVGFAYPNYQHFGTREDLLTVPAYNLALLRKWNYCHASSLFDGRVFEAGARWSEEREGFEDWDLVLSLAERGVSGVPVPGRTLLYRKHGFSLVTARRFERESPEDAARRRHGALYHPESGIKARWAPALSVVLLDGEWPQEVLADQTCSDFELVRAGDPVEAIADARGRFVVVAAPAAAPALARAEFAEQALRALWHAPALTALALATGSGARFPFAAIGPELPADTELAGVGWERPPGADAPEADLGLTGSLLEDLLVSLQGVMDVQWRGVWS